MTWDDIKKLKGETVVKKDVLLNDPNRKKLDIYEQPKQLKDFWKTVQS